MSKLADAPVKPFSASGEELTAFWTDALIGEMLSCVWRGYDLLLKSEIPAGRLDDENWLNQRLTFYLQTTVPKRASFVVVNQYMEFSTRVGRRSTPPTPEIGFVLKAQPDLAFVGEAKLLHNSRHLSKYVGKLRSHFLNGKYAPFCPEGMMIGYLFSKSAQWAFREICGKLNVELEGDSRFSSRNHRRSRHRRALAPGRASGAFVCHHVLMVLGQVLTQGQLL